MVIRYYRCDILSQLIKIVTHELYCLETQNFNKITTSSLTSVSLFFNFLEVEKVRCYCQIFISH
jgi:hypothetical protein